LEPELIAVLVVLIEIFDVGDFTMNRRDQELLQKQLHGLTVASRSDGVLMLAVVGVFVAGIALGSLVYPKTVEPMRIAANDAPAILMPPAAPPIAR
jgi:hypothetical protein